MTTAPPFAYYGGKTRIAETITALLPAHRHYVEPFAGSLAVLLAKPRADHETVNDLDGDLMLFWRMLRDHPDELASLAALTPHSRAETLAAVDLDAAPTDMERARRVWVLLSQGRGGTLRRNGWRHVRQVSGTTSTPDYLAAYADRMPPAARRLAGVSLECRDALTVVRDYGQDPATLIYADPPYAAETGRSLHKYRAEASGEAFHRDLAAALHAAAAAVVLSGYPCDLYDRHLYADWCRVEIAAFTGQGTGSGRRTEALWSNRPLGAEDLFSRGAS